MTHSFKIDMTWYTIVTDQNGYVTIRKAKCPDEEMNPSFDALKTGTIKSLMDKKAELEAEVYSLELNIQGLRGLQEKDVGFLGVPDTRSLN